jgi:8-amino-3,8-dideoxy-alpha-D-manno-octulosonate transaminase
VAFAAVELKPGDEIVLPAYSFLACATAALTCGLVPVFAECDASLLVDPEDLKRRITSRTRAILAVHMNGAASDLDALVDIAASFSLPLIEDCSQAVGACYHGREVGTFGDVATFSFQFMKTVAAGEGGLLVTDDERAWQRAAYFQDLGFHRKGRGGDPVVGENLRMAELPGAVALSQLRREREFTSRMRRAHRRLRATADSLDGIEVRPVPDIEGDAGSSLVLSFPDEERARFVRKALRAENVPCDSCRDKVGYLYPVLLVDPLPVPFWPPEIPKPRYHAGMCPRTEEVSSRSNAIPISPSLTDDEVEGIERALHKIAAHLTSAQVSARRERGREKPGAVDSDRV